MKLGGHLCGRDAKFWCCRGLFVEGVRSPSIHSTSTEATSAKVSTMYDNRTTRNVAADMVWQSRQESIKQALSRVSIRLGHLAFTLTNWGTQKKGEKFNNTLAHIFAV